MVARPVLRRQQGSPGPGSRTRMGAAAAGAGRTDPDHPVRGWCPGRAHAGRRISGGLHGHARGQEPFRQLEHPAVAFHVLSCRDIPWEARRWTSTSPSLAPSKARSRSTCSTNRASGFFLGPPHRLSGFVREHHRGLAVFQDGRRGQESLPSPGPAPGRRHPGAAGSRRSRGVGEQSRQRGVPEKPTIVSARSFFAADTAGFAGVGLLAVATRRRGNHHERLTSSTPNAGGHRSDRRRSPAPA